jgi:hypothetical protein
LPQRHQNHHYTTDKLVHNSTRKVKALEKSMLQLKSGPDELWKIADISKKNVTTLEKKSQRVTHIVNPHALYQKVIRCSAT